MKVRLTSLIILPRFTKLLNMPVTWMPSITNILSYSRICHHSWLHFSPVHRPIALPQLHWVTQASSVSLPQPQSLLDRSAADDCPVSAACLCLTVRAPPCRRREDPPPDTQPVPGRVAQGLGQRLGGRLPHGEAHQPDPAGVCGRVPRSRKLPLGGARRPVGIQAIHMVRVWSHSGWGGDMYARVACLLMIVSRMGLRFRVLFLSALLSKRVGYVN